MYILPFLFVAEFGNVFIWADYLNRLYRKFWAFKLIIELKRIAAILVIRITAIHVLRYFGLFPANINILSFLPYTVTI